MPLNLLLDPWIPMRDVTGETALIAPWQMAENRWLAPDWPRADLNIACLELLIGLVYLADPPISPEDWRDRQAGDPTRLRDKLTPFAPAFNLTGDGPLFLQDMDRLDGDPNPPDMLFIDSAGANTARNNADLMVHRDRYARLDLPLAAMALFAFQAHAPSGGAGNRTSMRGGGPLVTLVDPGQGLWPLIWSNVPEGQGGKLSDLPWMRATRVSDTGAEVLPPQGRTFGIEAFFGMPRRLRLVEENDAVVGAIQKPYGTNYGLWVHPLTPYYRQKPGTELLPVHPRAGLFGYRHWLGILAEASGNDGLKERALALRNWENRGRDAPAQVIVAGWAMDNMKPRDFTFSTQPVVNLSAEQAMILPGMITAADQAALALRSALEPILAAGETREMEREAFFTATEPAFRKWFDALKAGEGIETVGIGWRDDLRCQALAQFDALALPGLDQRETDGIEAIVKARRYLGAAFAGFGVYGKAIFDALMLEKPEQPKKKGKAA